MNSHRNRFFLQSGVLLTFLSFISSVINYVFQAVMGRLLPLDEFGYMTTTLGIILLASVPLSAASQTIAHYVARLQSDENPGKLNRFRLSSQRWLWRGTWGLAILCILVWKPAKDFFNFPRNSLSLAGLACLPVQLWSVLAAAWCAGLERFLLLGCLTLGQAILRLVVGAGCAAYVYHQAESGVIATFCGACVLGSALFLHHRTSDDEMPPAEAPSREFFYFLASSICVGIANFLFFQSDQIIAQRHFHGEILGIYSAAGILGRAVIWGSLPFLTVYFTQRSGTSSTNPVSWRLKVAYFGCLLAGSFTVFFFREFLCKILLGRIDLRVVALMGDFAVVMFLSGILQGIGFFYLATRRFFECLLFGLLGFLYPLYISWQGKTPEQLLMSMRKASFIAILIFGACSCFLYFFKKRKTSDQ